MNNLTPKTPYRPLVWTDAILELQDLLADWHLPVYVVGGGVRDALLSRPIKDLDLATPDDSVGLARKIANAFPNGAFYVMDAERGVARALIETMHGRLNIDVARFRGEAGSLLDDLQDRDFTLNALAVDLKADMTQIIDPLGGEQDIFHKVLRQCNPQAIASDPIRALRAIRQSTQLSFKIEPQTLLAVRACSGILQRTSEERVRDELMRILNLPRPTAALRVMDKLGLLDESLPLMASVNAAQRQQSFMLMDKIGGLLGGLHPTDTDTIAIDFGFGLALMRLNPYRRDLAAYFARTWVNERPHRALLMLAALCADLPANEGGIGALADGLRLSGLERKWLLRVLGARRVVHNLADESVLSQHRYWHTLGDDGLDVLLFTLGDELAQAGVALQKEAWLSLVERVGILADAYYLHHDTIVAPPSLLDGDILMQALGIKAGKRVGQLLSAIREAQVQGEVHTLDDALQFARAHLGKNAPKG